MEASTDYTAWVAQLREMQSESRDLSNRITEGTASPDQKNKFNDIVPKISILANQIQNFRTAQNQEQFKQMESALNYSLREQPTAPARAGARFYNLGAEKTEEEVLDQKTIHKYGSLERELGQKKFSAISDPEYKMAVESALRYGWSGVSNSEMKALDSGADERGAVTAPAEVINMIISRLNAPTRVGGIVKEINTARDSVQFYRNAYDGDDMYTNSFRRIATGSRPATDTEAIVTGSGTAYVEPVKIQVHTYMMVGQIENDLLMDSSFDLMSWFTNEISKSAAQDRDNDIINGTGVGQNMGIMNYVGTGAVFGVSTVNTGDANLLTVAGLSNLLWDLPEQYCENAVLTMSRTHAGKALGALRGSTGLRVYGDVDAANGASMVGPSGQKLEGYPVIYSSKMPTVAAGTFPILFWDPSAYVSLTRQNISIKILDQTRAKQNMTEIVAKIRYGGDLVEPYRCRAQKVSV